MKPRAAFGVVALAGLAALAGAPAQAAVSHALIQGSGSSWSANAVNQWIADVHSNGLQVVFTANGSAQGRKDFALKTTDYAVSDIGYQGKDPITGDDDSSDGRAYAYLPIVAGGTSFPYQIKVGGKLVRNLRLSGLTLAKIFTNQISNWNDPAVTADNNGHALPSLPIIPVVHSEGSGSSAQFTRYLATEFASMWKSFNNGNGSFTEYFPRQGAQVAENGSDGVMNFISSAAANGAIGYDEYSYALGKGYPVAKLENSAGYFTLPTQYNVAVALTQAQINMDKSSPNYLLQNLDNVYTYNDVRTYPLSSYSYMIIPTASDDPKMTTAKRQTLADFLYYSICAGQKEMGPIGYSPLPINLVQAGFDQVSKLHEADSGVVLTNENVSSCHNPTFVAGQPSRNYLAEIAPKPLACDKAGAGPCAAGVVTPGAPRGSGGSPATTYTGGGGTTATVGTSGATGGGGSSGALPGSGSSTTTINPVTGQPQLAGAANNGIPAASVSTLLPDSQGGRLGYGLLAALLLLAAIVGPPLLFRRIPRPNGEKSS